MVSSKGAVTKELFLINRQISERCPLPLPEKPQQPALLRAAVFYIANLLTFFYCYWMVQPA